MNKLIGVLVTLAACAAALTASPSLSVDELIFPHPDRKIVLVEAEGVRDGLLTGRLLSEGSPLENLILKELNLPFHVSVIRLNQCARNFRGDTEGPNVLYLSQNEGGFPRQGLILQDQKIAQSYPELFYVDLVLDESRMESGELDIFSHELGHVMMLNIWRNIPDQRSTKQHVSMGITDTTTAVFEGWGIHFQRLAHDSVQRYAEKFTEAHHYSRSQGRRWHSNIDQKLRIHGVLQNDYIHQKLLPRVDTGKMSLEELIILEHVSPLFDPTRLRNAQQMLSCEGVMATLFYRINTNASIRGNYQDRDFYNRFLLSAIPEHLSPQDVFTPFENVVLKHFWIWSRLDERLSRFSQTSLPIEYIKEWVEAFPDDREELVKIFIFTTAGKTVNNELGRIYETMSYSGLVGDYQGFRTQMSDYEKASRAIITKVLKDECALDANVGPQLWIVNQDFQIRRALWTPQTTRPLAVDLNTASAWELASFSGMTLDAAEELVRKREEKGYFQSVEEAEDLGFKHGGEQPAN